MNLLIFRAKVVRCHVFWSNSEKPKTGHTFDVFRKLVVYALDGKLKVIKSTFLSVEFCCRVEIFHRVNFKDIMTEFT